MIKEGIYEEIINKKLQKELSILGIADYEINKERIDVEEARKLLASYIDAVTRKALRYIREDQSDDAEALLNQIKTCNDIISILAERLDKVEFESLKIGEEGEILTSIYSKINSINSVKKEKRIRPITSIAQSTLFTGSHYEPSMLEEIKREILTSDSIDMFSILYKVERIKIYHRRTYRIYRKQWRKASSYYDFLYGSN